MKKTMLVALIGHQADNSSLPCEYSYLTRKSESELFQTVDSTYSFKAPSYVWSEYAAWFENSSIVKNVEITGLFHYRCALNLYKFRLGTFPIYLRKFFLNLQTLKLQKMTRFLIVGEPNIVPETVWEQFTGAHPEIETFLEIACAKYDNIMNRQPGEATQRLKASTSYYPRNIFVTDTDFGREWIKISFDIAADLDTKLDITPSTRWGGFVIERIFTLFVEDYAKTNNIEVSTAQQTYFVKPSTWLKIQLLRIQIISNAHRKWINH